MTHGELVNKLLRLRNMTPATLSKQTGINRQTIYSIINKDQKRTKPDVYKLLAMTLNVPEYIFAAPNDDNENLLAELFKNDPYFKVSHNKRAVPSDTYLLELMDAYHRDPEFILNGLEYVSLYSKYSSYEIRKLLQNAYYYDEGLFAYLENLIKYGISITKTEYQIIEKLRALNLDKQQTICTLIDQLLETSNNSGDIESTAKPIGREL